MHNRFIVLEGIDGSGTTTQLQCLAECLRADGATVVTTGEPTSGPVGRLLRQILEGALATDGASDFDWVALALLFAADRASHAKSVIQPALQLGHVVICDRYDLSSRIYQSVTAPEPGSALPWVCAINGYAPRPDLTLVLDVAPDLAEQRRAKRGAKSELFEQSQLQRKLAQAYLDAERYVPNDRLKHVRGDLPIREVTEILYAACVGG
jgi:dTMP kinase